MEIIQERLEREYDLNLVTTAPSVPYRIEYKDGTEARIERPSELDPSRVRALDNMLRDLRLNDNALVGTIPLELTELGLLRVHRVAPRSMMAWV